MAVISGVVLIWGGQVWCDEKGGWRHPEFQPYTKQPKMRVTYTLSQNFEDSRLKDDAVLPKKRQVSGHPSLFLSLTVSRVSNGILVLGKLLYMINGYRKGAPLSA